MSADLKRDFPEITDFFRRNLKYMRALALALALALAEAEAFPDREIVQQVIAQSP